MNTPIKILAWCDSPSLTSGFARVAFEILRRWAAYGASIDVWAIGFNGLNYDKCPWARLVPAGDPWFTAANMQLFVNQLIKGRYTHVWIMQDSFLLSQCGLPQAIADACKENGIRSAYYFPVDAEWDPAWAEILACVDAPIAYTEYGKAVATNALMALSGERMKEASQLREFSPQPGGELPELPPYIDPVPREDVAILGHGCSPVFCPETAAGRAGLREKCFPNGWLNDGDWLMVNVSQHQKRKDLSRSLEILAELRRRGVPAKLVLHCAKVNPGDGTDLAQVGRQLGLSWGKEFVTNDAAVLHNHGLMSDAGLRELYNVADAALTTSMGEGWGFMLTEALACGCPVVCPDHTSCREIARTVERLGMPGRFTLLPATDRGSYTWDSSRVRPRVNVNAAANLIKKLYQSGRWRERPPLNDAVKEWLNWDRIALAMWERLMGPEANSENRMTNTETDTSRPAPGT